MKLETGDFYGKWMIAGACVGLLLPFGTTLMVTGNMQGAQYVRQQERMEAGNYRILLDQSEGSENGNGFHWKNISLLYWQYRYHRTAKWKP